MSRANQPPEPPTWDGGDAAPRGAEPIAKPGGAKTVPPPKADRSAAGEEDPGSALDSLDAASGQPEAKKPGKS